MYLLHKYYYYILQKTSYLIRFREPPGFVVKNSVASRASSIWNRTSYFADCNSMLAYCQAQSLLEHAHGDSLLDIGFGDCVLTEILCSKFRRVVGTDASRTHLEKAKERSTYSPA